MCQERCLLSDKTIELNFLKKAVSIKAIQQVMSQYQEEFAFNVSEIENKYVLELIPKSEMIVEKVVENMSSQIIDQQIRLDLQQEFGQLRDIIVRYAFFPAEEECDDK